MQVPLLYHCLMRFTQAKGEPWAKTYNSGYSLVVTHLTTNPPVRCLNRAERTGSLVFNVLWSYVTDITRRLVHNAGCVGPSLCLNMESQSMRFHLILTNAPT